jgi:hypothetical protein
MLIYCEYISKIYFQIPQQLVSECILGVFATYFSFSFTSLGLFVLFTSYRYYVEIIVRPFRYLVG